jgi:glycolate oxidase iron-sulfur subunit
VRDFHEFLAEVGLETPQRPLHARVTYDDPCHLCHAQGISRQPRALLQQIPGLDYVELPEASWCCGSAGTYNITQPAMAETILRDKVEHIRETGADVVASANPGCMLQLEAGLRRYGVKGTVRHVSELLDAAYGS